MENIILFAIIGNIVFLFSGLPEIYTLIKYRTRKGLNPIMIWCWFIGNASMFIYNFLGIKDFFNSLLFGFNLGITTIIISLYYFWCKE